MDPCPLRFNYKRQTLSLISRLPSDSPYVALLHNATSTAELLQTLSSLLSKPELTLTIATLFRPLLLDLCARWLYRLSSSRLAVTHELEVAQLRVLQIIIYDTPIRTDSRWMVKVTI